MTVVRLMVVIALCGAVTGCYGHVRLPPPPPASAPVEERRDYAERMRATQVGTAVTITSNVGGVTTRKMREVLQLGDGTLVRHPEDLVPVVGAASVPGRAALRAAETQRLSNAWAITAGGFAVGGGTLAAVGLQVYPSNLVIASGLALAVAGVVPGGIAVFLSVEASEQRIEAFESYVRDGP